MKRVYLNALSTDVPQYECSQEEIRDWMLSQVKDRPVVEHFIRKVYQKTGIKKRYSVLPDFCFPSEAKLFFFPAAEGEPTFASRNEIFRLESARLAQSVVRKLFSSLPQFDPQTITHLVTHSCTGCCAPGFDYDLVKDLHLPTTIHRFHLGFMGCFAAFPALKLAHSLCMAQDNARVLIVGVELCSLHFQSSWEPEEVIAYSLFGDGASCALISGDLSLSSGAGLVLHGFGSQIIPNSSADLAWTMGKQGFVIKLSSYVPSLIEAYIGSVLEELFLQCGWNRNELSLWAIHPGGRSIIEKVAETLNLGQDDTAVSYDVLRDYGNMSSVTIFFLLRLLLQLGKKGKLFSCAFGPGLTVESALMELF